MASCMVPSISCGRRFPAALFIPRPRQQGTKATRPQLLGTETLLNRVDVSKARRGRRLRHREPPSGPDLMDMLMAVSRVAASAPLVRPRLPSKNSTFSCSNLAVSVLTTGSHSNHHVTKWTSRGPRDLSSSLWPSSSRGSSLGS